MNFRQTVTRVVEDILGPEPVGKAGMTKLATYQQLMLSGRSTNAHFGMRGDPSMSFMGLVASPQKFQGAAQMGANTGYTVQAWPALPSGHAPPALPGANPTALNDPMTLLGGL
jgi:hypothetical protein